jgi:hypothetical protein
MNENYLDTEFYSISYKCNIDGIQDVLDTYGYTLYEVIDICGGMPISNVTGFRLTAQKFSDCIIEVTIRCNDYYLIRMINFQAKYVYNSFLRVSDPGAYLGTTLFLNQVAATKNKFNFLKVLAAGKPGEADFTGYYKWGRVGYFQDHLSHLKFKHWAYDNDIEANSLHEYLVEDYNYVIWQMRGHSWLGSFNLNEDSPNMKYLREYLIRKGIQYNL